jgi:hypothetical protein
LIVLPSLLHDPVAFGINITVVQAHVCDLVFICQVAVAEGFRLFCTTRLPRPHFSPELCAKVTLVDFTVTQAGLEDQLLGKLILKVRNGVVGYGPRYLLWSRTTDLPSRPFHLLTCFVAQGTRQLLC